MQSNLQSPKTITTEDNRVKEHLLSSNSGPIGAYFRDLEKQPLRQWERRVLFQLLNTRGYKTNDPTAMLEFATDLRTANEAQIKFFDKYTGEQYLPGVADKEREEVDFIDNRITPFLLQQIG
jgi:hypothetical protein